MKEYEFISTWFILPFSKLRASFMIYSFSKRLGGKWESLYPIISALNKINKTYLPTFSARDDFSFYERKKTSFKKKDPQFNITDISKNLLQAFEIQEEQQSLNCFESGQGKLVYQEYTYILGACWPLSRFTISVYCSVD